jgi:thiol-disulfide isomerase/thioredoxin
MKNYLFLAFLMFLIVQNITFSQTQINQKVENFTLLNLNDGSNINLNDYAKEQILILVFTSINCPYSKFYQNRIEKLVEKYKNNPVKFLFVVPESSQESAEQVKSTLKNSKNIYLYDKGQNLTNKLGATKTPEVFVLQQNVGFFFIKYFGAIDDNPQSEQDVTNTYLVNAIENLLAKKNIELVNQKPTGCMIKK